MAIPHVPRTAEEFESAVRKGALAESLHFDAKGVLEASAKANRALAIDLAAMAVNGGLIVVGVAEDSREGGKVLAPRRATSAHSWSEPPAIESPRASRPAPSASDLASTPRAMLCDKRGGARRWHHVRRCE